MSFDDLPADWSDRPLRDPTLVADVLDLFCSWRARREGALVLLACDAGDRLAHPVEISDVGAAGGLDERVAGFCSVLDVLAEVEPDVGVLAAIARPGGLSVTADDVCWAEALAVAAVGRVRLLGVHVVTQDGSRPIPRLRAA